MSLKENSAYWDQRSEIFDGQIAKIYEEAYKKTVKYTLDYVKKEDHILKTEALFSHPINYFFVAQKAR